MSGRSRLAFAGEAPQWCVVTAHPDRVVVNAYRQLRTDRFPAPGFPVAGVLVPVVGFMAALDLDRLPAVFGWPEAVARFGDVRLDAVVLRFGWRLRPHADRRLLGLRWAQAVARRSEGT